MSKQWEDLCWQRVGAYWVSAEHIMYVERETNATRHSSPPAPAPPPLPPTQPNQTIAHPRRLAPPGWLYERIAHLNQTNVWLYTRGFALPTFFLSRRISTRATYHIMAAARVFQNTELLCSILEQTTNWLFQDKRTLATCALVCHSFSDCALDILWRELSYVGCLLKVVPSVQEVAVTHERGSSSLTRYVSRRSSCLCVFSMLMMNSCVSWSRFFLNISAASVFTPKGFVFSGMRVPATPVSHKWTRPRILYSPVCSTVSPFSRGCTHFPGRNLYRLMRKSYISFRPLCVF